MRSFDSPTSFRAPWSRRCCSRPRSRFSLCTSVSRESRSRSASWAGRGCCWSGSMLWGTRSSSEPRSTRSARPSTGAERPQQVAGGPGTVRVLGLPVVAELRDSLLLACGDEDRVEAEPRAATRFLGDPALEDAGATHLLALRREGDQLADVACAAAVSFDALELCKQPLDRLASAEARGEDPRGASEAVDLDSRILADHPLITGELAAVKRLPQGIFVVGRPIFRRVGVGVEQAQVTALEHPGELPELVLVP